MISVALAIVAALSAAPHAQTGHERRYWQSIKNHNYAVPAGASPVALATELAGLLGSSDPVLRDELASAILTRWIADPKVLSPAQIRPLILLWTTNLQDAVGASNDNSVLLRSYSALALADAAARDVAEPYLSADEHARLLTAALTYLKAEKDLRGFDDRLGWLHSAAHTADLIKFLGRGSQLTVPGQRAILTAVGAKMRDASVVFTFGEDERYARAIAVLMIRPDFDLDGFRAWVTETTRPDAAPVTVAGLHARQNVTNLLSKLAVLLTRQPTLPAAAEAARVAILAAVKF